MIRSELWSRKTPSKRASQETGFLDSFDLFNISNGFLFHREILQQSEHLISGTSGFIAAMEARWSGKRSRKFVTAAVRF